MILSDTELKDLLNQGTVLIWQKIKATRTEEITMKNMIIAAIAALALSACFFSKKEEAAEEGTAMEQEMPAEGEEMAPEGEAPAEPTE